MKKVESLGLEMLLSCLEQCSTWMELEVAEVIRREGWL